MNRRSSLIGLVALLLLLALPGISSATDKPRIIDRVVTFKVTNLNRSAVPCAADGQTYQVRGHLVGTETALADPQTITLLLHGLSYGEFFSHYAAQQGYHFARKQARAGHVTATIDRLGYDGSDKPQGNGICFGSRADIANQMVQQLKAGSYDAHDASPAFDKVVLAGHSVGGIIAQAATYSFGDADGLMVLSYSDTVVSAAAQQALQVAVQECQAGGDSSDGDSGPTGYVYFGADTPQQFIQAHFFTPNADPTIVQTTAALRNRDPCGDVLSYEDAVATNLAQVQDIDVPTLVLTGGEDAIYPTPATTQAALLTGSPSVTAVTIADTGHAMTLHRSADEFQGQVSRWLNANDFAR